MQTECVYEMKDNETSQIRIVEYRTYGFNGELISDWGENKPEVFYKWEDDMVKKLFERSVSVCSPMSIRTPDELSAERRMIAARYFIGRTGDVHVCLWAQDGNVSDKLVVVVDVKHGQLEEIARTQYGSLLNEVSSRLCKTFSEGYNVT